jgi:cell division protein FtsB
MKREPRHLPLPPTDILTLLVSTAAVFFTLAFGGKLLEGYRLQRHNAMLRAEIGGREEQQKQLQQRLDYVQTPAYVEKVAREQYKWVRAGENLVITIFRRRPVVEPTPTPPAGPTTGTTVTQAVSHWPEWWNLLAGRAPNP